MGGTVIFFPHPYLGHKILGELTSPYNVGFKGRKIDKFVPAGKKINPRSIW